MASPFQFNSDAQYQPGVQADAKSAPQLIEARVQIRASVPGEFDEWFEARYPDVFEKYRLRVTSDKVVQAWSSSPMKFWQNKVNFAVWCATTGCGVSTEDHLNSETPMARSVYRFHVYYQIRRILEEMQVPLPQDDMWDAFDTPYNQRAYERICAEFGVSPHTDWRQKLSENSGLGTPYHWWKGRMRTIKEVSDDAVKNDINPRFGVSSNDYRKDRMSFANSGRPATFTVDYIDQGEDGETAWATFILDKSDGFTQPGVERINDSIRTYVWAILGAQAQTRTSIIGEGTAFDAQKQFLANVEDAIASPVDLPSAIARYQDVLRYARSKVNFVFGIGLYMAPGDMELQIGTIQDYNNMIVVAEPGQKLGINTNINVSTPSQPDVHDMEGPAAGPAQPVEVGPVKTAAPSQPDKHDMEGPAQPGEVGPVKPAVPPVATESHAEVQAHYDGLTALVVVGVAVGLGWLALR